MRGSDTAQEAIGKAEFAEALSRLKLVRLGTERLRVNYGLGKSAEGEADLFRVLGTGFDGLTLFVARDPEVAQVVVYGAGIRHGGDYELFMDRTDRRATKDEAMLEGIKYLLRIPEEERAEAWDRMKKHGTAWSVRR